MKSEMIRKANKYALALLGALALSSCGGGGSCANCSTPTPTPTPTPSLSLTIEAPTQYPAGLPVAINAQLTMTNTSTIEAKNLVYTIPAPGQTGNNTGVTITPNAGIGSSSGACTDIAAGASCTFTAIISAYANPGSFTVTATPNTSSLQSGTSKTSLKSDSISVTANLGLVNTPNTNNNFYILPNAQTIVNSSSESTTVMVSVLVKSISPTFNNIKLVDEAGNLLDFSAVGIESTALNSVNTYKIVIPAGKSVQYIQAFSYQGSTPACTTLNNGTNNSSACSNNALVNISTSNIGTLTVQPSYFNLNSNYESQLVVLQNTGAESVSNLSFTALSSPLSISNNNCTNVILSPNATCTFRISYSGIGSGSLNYFVNYYNGKYTASTGLTVAYGASSYGLLTATPIVVSLTPNNLSQSIVLTNTGYGTVSNLSLPTLPHPLLLNEDLTNCSAGQSLASGASCIYSIKYSTASTAGSTNLSFGYNNGVTNYSESVSVSWVPVTQYAFTSSVDGSANGVYRCPIVDESGTLGACVLQANVVLDGNTNSTQGLAFANVGGVKYLYVTSYNFTTHPVSKCILSSTGDVTSCNESAGDALVSAGRIY